MSTNPVQHRRTKHIEIDIHFVREKVSLGEVRVLHVPTTLQFADVMTKGLLSHLFLLLVQSLHPRTSRCDCREVLACCNYLLYKSCNANPNWP
jgi:hypothetical protein